jgi:hypothetical protein
MIFNQADIQSIVDEGLPVLIVFDHLPCESSKQGQEPDNDIMLR